MNDLKDTGKMTRRRALKIAATSIGKEMQSLAVDANIAARDKNASVLIQNRALRYADLAEALKIVENMAQQKEMHL